MECKHKNKEIEIDEKKFYCEDCKKWIGFDKEIKQPGENGYK